MCQVVADGIGTEFLAVRTQTGDRSRLPAQRTSLIGRDEAVGDVRQRLLRGRLVTLTGAGGCGKTRRAVEVAGRQAQMFTDGACFVDPTRVG